MALERERDQAVEELRVRDSRCLEELRVDARRREPRDRVDLVHDDLAVRAHEEVDARHPLALGGDERLDRELADARVRLGRDARRDDEVHAALVVLRRVVVPVGVRDDLADDRGDRVAVAEDAALDLDSVDALLDQHLVVVAARELDGGGELARVVNLRDADRRAEPRRLHEHRVVEGVLRLVAVAERDVPRDRDPAVSEHGLEQVLVHAQRGGGDAGADVGDARELEEALHGAVLAERAVEDREHDVDLAERRGRRGVGDDRERLDARAAEAPARPEASSQRPPRSISTTTVS